MLTRLWEKLIQPSVSSNVIFTSVPRKLSDLPHLEFASAVWDPYRQDQVDKIEAVQRRAARFIKKDHDWNSSVSQLLHSLSLERLKERRKIHHLWTFYQAHNNIISLPVPHYYQQTLRLTLYKTKWSWESRTWPHKMTLINTTTNSPHYFYWKCTGLTNENLNFDIRV